MFFAATAGSNIGFSAPVRGSPEHPDPAARTAAVRKRRTDVSALWRQVTIGSAVEVVP